MPRPVRVVLVDHHDSFTHNLAHLIASVSGALPELVCHDDVDADQVLSRASHVVLSPGPGTPNSFADFAVGRTLLRQVATPVLGVCLGMQGLAVAYGGAVSPVQPAHGHVSRIRHDGRGFFRDLPQDFAAVRYHSLAVTAVPEPLDVTARSEDGVVMGLRHRFLPHSGVQFHPESVLTEHGRALVAGFLAGSP
jgi:anthranilate synthase/aminodeoxychorismate synthase-like glutamine amidotransferase